MAAICSRFAVAFRFARGKILAGEEKTATVSEQSERRVDDTIQPL